MSLFMRLKMMWTQRRLLASFVPPRLVGTTWSSDAFFPMEIGTPVTAHSDR